MTLGQIEILNLPANDSTKLLSHLGDIEIRNYFDEGRSLALTMELQCDYKPVTTEVYTIPYHGTLRLKLADIITNLFDFRVPEIKSGISEYASSNIVDIDITFTQGSVSGKVNFFVINHRRQVYVNEDYFLDKGIFNIQPYRKNVQPTDIEFLTIYTPGNTSQIWCKAGTKSELVASIEPGLSMLSFDIQSLLDLFPGERPESLYLHVRSNDDEGLIGQQYRIVTGEKTTDSVFYFENSLGGFERIRMRGNWKKKNKYKASILADGEVNSMYHLDRGEVFTIGTGYLETEEEKEFYRDFIESKNKFLSLQDRLVKVVVKESTAEDSMFEVAGFSFDFIFEKDSFLGLHRNTEFITHPNQEGLQLHRYYELPDRQDDSSLDFYITKGGTNYNFKSPDFYDVRISPRLHSHIKVQQVYKETNRVGFKWTDIPIPPEVIRGYFIVEDLLTGEEARLQVAFRKNGIRRILPVTLVFAAGQLSTIQISFQDYYKYGYYTDNYSIQVPSEVVEYIQLDDKYITRVKLNDTPIYSYITVYDLDNDTALRVPLQLL